jgi:endonuclease/exonuclease/phosphatase family metal-dependent hydrolase
VFHRKPVQAVFRVRRGESAGLDFRAIAVHLKAGAEEEDLRKRGIEARILRDHVASLDAEAGLDRDTMILGDFNHSYDAPAHRALTRGGELTYLRPGVVGPTILHFDAPVDHIAVSRTLDPLVRIGSMQVHRGGVDLGLPAPLLRRAKARWRAGFSDHFPVTVDLEDSGDRDPDATFETPRHPLTAVKHR